MPGYIIVGGKHVPCAVRVEPWTVTGIGFKNVRPRTARTDLVVLHWTGGENHAEGLVKNMTKDGVSVQFYVDGHGNAFQLCDADMHCSHASGMNARGPGIEAANRANDKADALPKRQLLRETFAGSTATYTAFYPEQVRSILAITLSLCEAYGLPFSVPMDPKTKDVLARQFTPAELAAYRGVVGHCHWSPRRKRDPGLAMLRAVAAYGPRGAIGLSGPAE